MLAYVLPLVSFLIVSISMYYISNDPKKSDTDVILLRNVLPGLMIGLLVFVIIKYKDSELLNPEPLMYGNYFD
jgi:hypothetical protein